MRRRKRRRRRLKLKAFGQSTSTVGEENVNRYRFESLDFHLDTSRPHFLHDIETDSIEQVSLVMLVKRIRFRGETPLWSHLTLRCLNPPHKILCTCRKFANLYSGPNTSEAILVSAAHCNYVCKVFLISLRRLNSILCRMSLICPGLRFVAVVILHLQRLVEM